MTQTIDIKEPRFQFGVNWQRFLSTLTEDRIQAAMGSLRQFLQLESLAGRTFLDIGSGSGLFSLAAYRLGATVHSFDYDPQSVACTKELRQREQATDDRWIVEQGSVLDAKYMEMLGTFDIVYSWGVLHHTGNMWTAIDQAAQRTRPGGQFYLAIYNDQGVYSRIWRGIKRTYVALPPMLQPTYVFVVGGTWMLQRACIKLFFKTGGVILRLFGLQQQPASTAAVAASQRRRGMHLWYDLVDWIGGYPFEVASPEAIFRFLRDRGFQLQELSTCGGNLGCNEFVCVKTAPSQG
ncbi:methyltransferase domain-containing protein [bacterium]|nr:methyltransferase domain-containing protein [bacterium]